MSILETLDQYWTGYKSKAIKDGLMASYTLEDILSTRSRAGSRAGVAHPRGLSGSDHQRQCW